ncbi:glyoxylase-like metal-dependent hydrolase (beta-lactamase superfamily II) [Streptomyces aurantiacus]|uniref:MBL fold metallo-hydrolase n=1 Tax=Streptomyces aurantiacus TaxID=47760 RepID=UPI002790211B|nr:MBL fold metallo-hydrolase [Streptomyces aurantiacus]MDQ0778947.1 glyoxylase-like metal-dependent hydrolase (beta-lactamase superfamily II) [Streptomyces aurantiacus]
MNTITLGDIDITPVIDLPSAPVPREFVFPDTPLEEWHAQEALLAPDHWTPDEIHFVMRTWVVRSEGRTILVDTAVGNGKDRPNLPSHAHRRTDFLGNLARAGVRPEEVDAVLLTHLHGDHVGWNTYFDGTNWVPTFPNAHYVVNRADFDFYNPANGNAPKNAAYALNVFEDSVAPVHEAGLMTFWEDEYVVDGGLRIEPAPGHTPGSSVITLTSGTDRAVFVGDMLHSPFQLQKPDCSPALDEDVSQAAAARRRILGRACDDNALVLPAHLAGSGAAEIERDGDRFAIKEWAAF